MALRDIVNDTVAHDDCVSDAVNEVLTVGEFVKDVLPLKLVDSVGERDCDVDGVKDEENVALRDCDGDTVAQDDCVSDAVNESLTVGELVYDALAQKLADSVGERD